MSTMIATRRVYPVGYSTLGSQELIDELLKQPGMLLIDTRIKPWSWNELWRKEALQKRYGDQYRFAGKYLGNAALGTGGIEIADAATGIAGLVKYLGEGRDLILLCQCKVFDTCHVHEIVKLLSEQVAVDVVFLQRQPQEAAVVAKTDQQDAAIVEAAVEPLSDSQRYCRDDATVLSSDRPEIMKPTTIKEKAMAERERQYAKLQERWIDADALQEQRIKEYHEKWRSHGYPVPESIMGDDGYMIVPKPDITVFD